MRSCRGSRAAPGRRLGVDMRTQIAGEFRTQIANAIREKRPKDDVANDASASGFTVTICWSPSFGPKLRHNRLSASLRSRRVCFRHECIGQRVELRARAHRPERFGVSGEGAASPLNAETLAKTDCGVAIASMRGSKDRQIEVTGDGVVSHIGFRQNCVSREARSAFYFFLFA